MTRLIDADALAEQYTKMVERLLPMRGSIVPSDITTLIINAPTVDAVEVVRCKDCRYYNNDYMGKWCGRHQAPVWVKEDDFCSWGERRKP